MSQTHLKSFRNEILIWTIFRPDSMKKWIFKTDRPGLLLPVPFAIYLYAKSISNFHCLQISALKHGAQQERGHLIPLRVFFVSILSWFQRHWLFLAAVCCKLVNCIIAVMHQSKFSQLPVEMHFTQIKLSSQPNVPNYQRLVPLFFSRVKQ